MATEIRVVCAHHPQHGHEAHVYEKHTLAMARQHVIDTNHKAEMAVGARENGKQAMKAWYVGEVPYRVQTREVSSWTDVHDPHDNMDELFAELKEES